MKADSKTTFSLSRSLLTMKDAVLGNKALVLGVVLFLLIRLLWLETTISRDEGAFGFIGMMWAKGVLPTYWLDIQGPLTYGIYAMTISVFGNSIAAIRLLNGFLLAVSCIALYLIAKDLFGKKTAILALFFFGIAMNTAIFEAMTALTEPLSAPFMILSVLLCYRFGGNKSSGLVLSGFLMLIAALIRAINLVGFLVLFVILLKRTGASKKSLLRSIASVFIGASIPFIALLSYFGVNGDLGGLLALYVRSFEFSATVHVFQDVPLFIKGLFVIQGLPLWVFSVIGLLAVIRMESQIKIPLMFWAGIYLSLSLIPPTFGHRMILLLPAASVFAGVGLFSAGKWFEKRVNFKGMSAKRNRMLGSLLIATTLIALFIPSIFFQLRQYPQLSFQYDGIGWVYADSDYQTQTMVSNYLLSHTSQKDNIFVHGWAAEIYWLSGKSAPTKYVWSLGYLPETEYSQLVNSISKGDFKYIVAFSPSVDALLGRAESSDSIIRYFLYYYFQDLRINNAWVFSKYDEWNNRVYYNFVDRFNSSVKLCDYGNGTIGDPGKLDNVFCPSVTIRSINNASRYSIQHVPFGNSPTGRILKSNISYQVQIPANATLKFGIGIDQNFWNDTSGAKFEIYLNHGIDSVLIFRRTINPRSDDLDRQWVDCQVDLSQFANETVDIVFSVSPGPSGKNEDSFACWGNPLIVAG